MYEWNQKNLPPDLPPFYLATMIYRVTFYLKNPKAKRDTLIYAFPHFDGVSLKLSTGLKIHPNLWNSKRQRAKTGSTLETLLNDRLDFIAQTLKAIYLQLLNSGKHPTPEAIKQRYKPAAEPVIVEARTSLLEGYDAFLEAKKGRLQPGSLQVHRTAKKHLKEFGEKYDVIIAYDRIDAIFLDKFINYLLRVVQLNNTTAKKVVTTVGTYLRWAYDQGYSTSTEFRRFTQKALPSGERPDKAYLTMTELQAIMSLDLSSNPRLDRVRDLFILQAHTGLRYGDVQRLAPEHIQGDTIRLVTTKNRKSIAIPLLPAARAIWQKYNGSLPSISNQKQNDYLKELCELAKIDMPVVLVDYRGVERMEKTVPKHEVIGTHSAKRTFVTILRQRGVSVEAIMKITGNNRRTIETYIVNTESDAVNEVEKAWRSSP